MSLEAILAAIEATGVAELAEQARQTERQIEEIQAAAEQAAAAERAEAYQTALRPAQTEATRLLSQAALQAAKITAEAREALVTAVLAGVRQRLSCLRCQPAYRAVLQHLTQEAIQALGEEQPCLVADPRDEPLLNDILAGCYENLPVEFPLQSWGGVIAQSSDGRITVNNTLEARLEQAVPYIRRDLASFLQGFLMDAHATANENQPPADLTG